MSVDPRARPDEPAGRLPEAVPEIEALERRLQPVHRAAIRLLGRVASPGARVLDVGAGFGFFVAALRAAGFAAEGTEPSPAGVRFAERWLGVKLCRAPFGEWEGPAGTFDVAAAIDLLSREPDHAGILARVRAAVRPGGLVLLAWPGPRHAAGSSTYGTLTDDVIARRLEEDGIVEWRVRRVWPGLAVEGWRVWQAGWRVGVARAR